MERLEDTNSEKTPTKIKPSNGCHHEILETMEQLKMKTEEMVRQQFSIHERDQQPSGSANTIITANTQQTSMLETRGAESDGHDVDSLCGLVIAESDGSPMPAIEQMVDGSDERGQRQGEESERVCTQTAVGSSDPKEGTGSQPTTQQMAVVEKRAPKPNTSSEASTKLTYKPVEKFSNAFILPKPVATESGAEKLPSGIPTSQVIAVKEQKSVAKKAKAVGSPVAVTIDNKPIAKKSIKPKLSPSKVGETSKRRVAPPTMIVNPMDCMNAAAAAQLAPAKGPTRPRKRPPAKQKKANETRANVGNVQPSPTEQNSNDSSPSSSNSNTINNNLMMSPGMPNMIFPNQLALAPNGNLIAMPSYMQMPSSQPNGQPQFIPVMSSQIFLAMQQQQQQQSENGFAQASSSNPSVGSKIAAGGMMSMTQPNVNASMNPCSSMASSLVQPNQFMSSAAGGNQMFYRLTSKNGMYMPTMVTPQNMAQTRNSPSMYNPAAAGGSTFFNQSQQQPQQKFIQPKQVSSTSSTASRPTSSVNEKLQKTSPSNPMASQIARPLLASQPSLAQQFPAPGQTHQPNLPQQFAHLSNSQLAASLQGNSGMPRLVQITPCPVSGSGLSTMNNQQQQLQNAWGIANFSMAPSNPSCSSSSQAVVPSLTTTSIFPQMATTTSSDKLSLQEEQFPLAPVPIPKARKKRKPGTTVEEGEEASSKEANSVAGAATNDEEENEPPPLLCRDEFGKIENVFLREAALMHERCFDANGNKKAPIKHVIGDFVIEEDLEPFPCQYKQLLNGLTDYQSVDLEEEEEEEENETRMMDLLPSISRRPPSAAAAHEPDNNEANDEEDSDENSYSTEKRKKMRKKKSELELDRRPPHARPSQARPPQARPPYGQHSSPTSRPKKRAISSSSSRATTPIVSKRTSAAAKTTPEKKARRRREVENLLTMDFGPGKTPFQTTSVDKYTDEIMVEAQQQQRSLSTYDERLVRHSSESSHINLPVPSTPSISKAAKHKEAPRPVGRPPGISSNDSAVHDEHIPTSKPPSSGANHKKAVQPVETRAEVVGGVGDGGQAQDETQDEQAMLWGDERCIYCKMMFRELGKRHQENPQYCSKTCRRKFKKQKSASSLGVPDSSIDNLSRSRARLPSSSRGRINIDSLAAKHSSSAPQITAHSSSAFSATTAAPTSLKIRLRSPIEDRPGELFEMQHVLHSRTNSFMRGRANTAEFRDESSPEIIGYSCGSSSAGPDVSGGNNLVGYVHSHLHPHQHYSTQHHHHQLTMPAVTAADCPAKYQPATPSSLASHNHGQLYHFAPYHPAITPESVHYLQRDSPAPSGSGLSFSTTSPAPASAASMSSDKVNELEMLMARGVHTWGPSDVARWVNIVTNSDTNGERFLQEQVDGVALCYLTLPNLQNELNFKLGPAVKLFSSINALRAVSSATGVPLGE